MLNNIRRILEDGGFQLSRAIDTEALSFDLMARKDDILLIIKVMPNVDSQSLSSANELKALGYFLKGIPVVIGERTVKIKMEPGVLYLRFGLTIMSFDTFNDYITNGIPPVAFSAPGGFYVELDGDKLRELRENNGISIGDLSRAIGVSRKSIQMYEGGKSATIDIGLKIEEYLNTQIIKPLNPLSNVPNKVEIKDLKVDLVPQDAEVLNHLEEIGMSVAPTNRSPFNALSQTGDEVILTAVGDMNQKIRMRLRAIQNLSNLSHRDALLVTDKDKVPYKGIDIPVMKRANLKKVEDPEEIVEYVKNR